MDRFTTKQKALIRHLTTEEGVSVRDALDWVIDLDGDDINRETCPFVRQAGERDFSAFTDEEADAEWDASIESLMDDQMHEVPEWIRRYVDEDRMKEDMKIDGRGSYLNGWNGAEYSYKEDGEWIYIYKN